MQEWIRRSSSAPLTIFVGSSTLSTRRAMDAEKWFLVRALFSVIHRLENVSMAINMDDMPDSLRLSIAGSASNPDSHASLTLSSPRLRRIPICGALPSSFHPHINAILDSPSRVLRHITILCLDVHRQPALHIPAAASTPFTINRLSVITVLSIDQASAVTILRYCTSAVSITLSTSPNIFVFDDDGRSSSGHSILGETVAKLSYLVTLDLTNLGGNRSASSSPVQCSHLAPSPSQILQGRTRSGTWRARGQQPANSQQRLNTLPLWSFRKPAATSIPNLRPPTKIPLIRDPFPSIPIGGLTEGTFSAFNATNTLDLARASASTLKCLYAHSDWNWRYHDRPYDYVTEFPRLEQLALKLVLRLVDANDQWSAVNLIAHISTPILRKLLIVVPLWPDVDATGIPKQVLCRTSSTSPISSCDVVLNSCTSIYSTKATHSLVIVSWLSSTRAVLALPLEL